MIRLATQNDCASILNIYAPFITGTVITFEYKVPTEAEFSERMAGIQRTYPWLVCETDGRIAGYAYASRYKGREAFDWSVELSIYINPEFQGKKIGKALYSALLDILKLQGFYNAYAVITVPNTKSESLHRIFNFETIGHYRNVGYKFGSWRDVKTFGLKLNDYIKSPAKPESIDKVIDTQEFKNIIEKAEQMIAERLSPER